MKRWFWISLALMALSPAFALTPEWREVDVNKDGRLEKVAVTNLADIAFNEQGQIVGWYIKTVRATDFKGNYERAPNLVRSGQTLPGTLEGFTPSSREFIRREPGNPEADFIARFSDGSTTLTYTIHPRFLTIDVDVQSPIPRKLIWTGIGDTDTPITKWLGQQRAAQRRAGPGGVRGLADPTGRGFCHVPPPPNPHPHQPDPAQRHRHCRGEPPSG